MTSQREQLVADAQATIAAGSKSFRFASQLFDERTREHSWLLYSWCRACDDITDGQTLGHDAEVTEDPLERISFLEEKTNAALLGEETGLAAFDALGVVVAECGIDPTLTDDHLAGFSRDAVGWQPRTEEDLLSYCYQVAGAVGVMMAQVMGVDPDDRDTLDRAADLGIAFQLANIARDVIEDANIGRCYLPMQWLKAVGLAGEDITHPIHRASLARLNKRLADLADMYRASARVGAARLPFRSRWAINSASRIYGRVAEKARKLGDRAWDQRIVVPKQEKARLVALALLDSLTAPKPVDRTGLWTRP